MMTNLFAKSSLVLREETDDWAILFDPDSGESFGLDPVSVFIWKRLDGNHTFEQILSEMNDVFSDMPGDAQEHLQEFIQSLRENNLVLE